MEWEAKWESLAEKHDDGEHDGSVGDGKEQRYGIGSDLQRSSITGKYNSNSFAAVGMCYKAY